MAGFSLVDLLGGLGGGDLGTLQQDVAANDIFRQVLGPITSFKPDTSTWSSGQKAATAFGQAFLGGLSANLAKQNEAEQIRSAISALPALYADPFGAAVPSGVDKSAFDNLRTTVALKRSAALAGLNQDLFKQAQQQQFELGKTVLTGAMSNPLEFQLAQERIPGLGNIVKSVFGGSPVGTGVLKEPETTNLSVPETPVVPVSDEQRMSLPEPSASGAAAPAIGQKSFLDFYRETGDKAAAQKLFDKQLNQPLETLQAKEGLLGKFQGEQAYKDFGVLSQKYKATLDSFANADDPAQHFAIAKQLVQFIEPTNSVNNGEAQAALSSPNIPDQLRSYIVGALTHKGTIPSNVLSGMKRLADSQFAARQSDFERLRSGYDADALQANLIKPGEHVDKFGDLGSLVAPREQTIRKLIQQEAAAQGVPELAPLAEAVAAQESSFNPAAKGSKGELGLFQLMPETARNLGVDPSLLNDNIRGGVGLLKQLSKAYNGNIDQILAAYNAGQPKVDKGQTPRSTLVDYVPQVKARVADSLKNLDSLKPEMPDGARIVNASNAALLGLGHKAGAAIDTALEAIPGIGTVPLKDLGKFYELDLAERRKASEAYREEHPKRAIAEDLVAGGPLTVASSMLMPANPLTQGAIFGALSGYGSGDGTQDSLIRSAIGAPFGAAAGGAAYLLGKGLTKGAELAFNKLDDLTGGAISNLFASQTGAVGGGAASNRLSPGEIYVAKQARDIAPEALTETQALLGQSAAGEVPPVVLPDVAGSERLRQSARFLANYKPSAEVRLSPTETFSPNEMLSERIANQAGRIGASVSDIGEGATAQEAGKNLVNAARGAVSAAETARSEATTPLYAQIGDYQMSAEMVDAVDDPIVRSAMDTLRSDPELATKFGGEAANSPNLMIAARKLIRDRAQQLSLGGEKLKASVVSGAADKLTRALETQPEFAPANQAYKALSGPINELAGTKEATGLAEKILGVDNLKTEQAGKALLELPVDAIQRLKVLLGDKGEDALKSGFKAYVLDITGKANEGKEIATKLFANDQLKQKAAAILGEDFSSFMKSLDLEKTISKATRAYNPGSTTRSNYANEEEFLNQMGPIKQVLSAPTSPRSYLNAFLDYMKFGKPSDATAQEAAMIMFNPQRGSEFLDKAAPFLIQRANRAKNVDLADQALRALLVPDAAIGGQGIANFLNPFGEPK